MSDKVREVFAACEGEGRAALVAYLTHGDPSPEGSIDVVVAACEAGADVIELGVPFSDPNADGVVIQEAMQRALAAGAGMDSALSSVAEIRRRGVTAPIVLFGYYNPIFVRGCGAFAEEAAKAGANAVLTVDLPIDELGELSAPLAAHGMGVVPLVAPTSTPERIAAVAPFSPSFTYYISMTGITGATFQGTAGGAERIEQVRAASRAPVGVGFGIKTAADCARVAAYADGVVVGSALVARVAAAPSTAEAAKSVAELVSELRAACVR